MVMVARRPEPPEVAYWKRDYLPPPIADAPPSESPAEGLLKIVLFGLYGGAVLAAVLLLWWGLFG